MRFKRILPAVSVLIILTGSVCSCGNNPSNSLETGEVNTAIYSMLEGLKNGDAKFFRDQVLTTVEGVPVLYDTELNEINRYEEIMGAHWISVPDAESLFVYSTEENSVGIAQIGEDFELTDNRIVLTSDKLMIDPTIQHLGDNYYMTVTSVEGTVNNDDEALENGTYTISLYSSADLTKWDFVTDIISLERNLEDCELLVNGSSLSVIYETELLDKANSRICIQNAKDETFSSWSSPRTLIPESSDHEPAGFLEYDGRKYFFYSTDRLYPGASYMGANVYYMPFTVDHEAAGDESIVNTETEYGILLYDVLLKDDSIYLLYAKDYLTTCDLVIEKQTMPLIAAPQTQSATDSDPA